MSRIVHLMRIQRSRFHLRPPRPTVHPGRKLRRKGGNEEPEGCQGEAKGYRSDKWDSRHLKGFFRRSSLQIVITHLRRRFRNQEQWATRK